MCLMHTDLPVPDGPRIIEIWSSGMPRLRPFRIVLRPNDFLTSMNSMASARRRAGASCRSATCRAPRPARVWSQMLSGMSSLGLRPGVLVDLLGGCLAIGLATAAAPREVTAGRLRLLGGLRLRGCGSELAARAQPRGRRLVRRRLAAAPAVGCSGGGGVGRRRCGRLVRPRRRLPSSSPPSRLRRKPSLAPWVSRLLGPLGSLPRRSGCPACPPGGPSPCSRPSTSPSRCPPRPARRWPCSRSSSRRARSRSPSPCP